MIAALSMAACTNANRFGADDGTNGFDANAGGAGVNTGIIPGSASDPTSTAYFQQAVGDRKSVV